MTLIHWFRRDIWDYCWNLGVPGNIIAGPIYAAILIIGDRLFLRNWHRVRAVEKVAVKEAAAVTAKHTAELHRLLHHANPEVAKQLGQIPHGGWNE